MSAEKYRDNVCAVIRGKSDDSVCVFHRKDFPPDSGWQFPQGGINPEKDLIDELKRELREEIGIDEVSVIAVSPNSYYYDFPPDIPRKHKGYRGQRQQWVLLELQSAEVRFTFEECAEFDEYQWVTAHEALRRIVPFKKKVYREALHDLNLI